MLNDTNREPVKYEISEYDLAILKQNILDIINCLVIYEQDQLIMANQAIFQMKNSAEQINNFLNMKYNI